MAAIVNAFADRFGNVFLTFDDGTVKKFFGEKLIVACGPIEKMRTNRSLHSFDPDNLGYAWMYLVNSNQKIFIDHVEINSPAASILLYYKDLPRRMYEGKELRDLKIAALDIEVFNDTGEIAAVSAAVFENNRIKTYFKTGSEKELILFVRWLFKQKPHILVGHNIFKFDLPILMEKAQEYNINLFADLYAIRKRSKRLAERTFEYDEVSVRGTEIIDTLILAQMWDVYNRSLDEFGLKEIAKKLGLASDDRALIDRSNIRYELENNFELFKKYSIEDAVEALNVFFALAPPFFELTRYMPISLGDAIRLGSGQLFDLALCCIYIENEIAIPFSVEYKPQTSGAYVDAFQRGVVDNCVQFDISSLYPSIMLAYNVEPQTDSLGAFQYLLNSLTKKRLELKKKAKEETDPVRAEILMSQANAAKILINSAYGMFSYRGAVFRDTDKGQFVADKGKEILEFLVKEVQLLGCKPIVCDTDGIVFTKESYDVEFLHKHLNQRIAEEFTPQIKIEFEGFYDKVFVHKKKNYVCYKKDKGIVKVRGGFFRSRRNEKFIREFVTNSLIHVFEGKDLNKLLYETANKVANKELSVEDIEIKVFITEDYDEISETKERLPQYKIAKLLQTTKGNRVSYYVRHIDVPKSKFKVADAAAPSSEFAHDYCVWFYLKRLKDVAEEIWSDISQPLPSFVSDMLSEHLPKSARRRKTSKQSS